VIPKAALFSCFLFHTKKNMDVYSQQKLSEKLLKRLKRAIIFKNWLFL